MFVFAVKFNLFVLLQGMETDALWYRVTLKKDGLQNEVSAVRVFKRISGPPPGLCVGVAAVVAAAAAAADVAAAAAVLFVLFCFV